MDMVNKHALFISPETKSHTHTHTHRCPYLDADFETRKNTFYEIVKSPDVINAHLLHDVDTNSQFNCIKYDF